MNKKKSNFSGQLGFVLAAAGSAVGVGNLWRFPYLAAKDGGGLFLVIYLALVLTFGFTLLASDIAIGRRTKESAIGAYTQMSPKWKFLGVLTFLVPVLIMTYYAVIGGWVTKYAVVYLTGQTAAAAQDNYFTSFITSPVSPVLFALLFMGVTAFIVYNGVEGGIERVSRCMMPILLVLVVVIAGYSLTLHHVDESGQMRTGMDGLLYYITPHFEGLTFSRFLQILLDAMSQLFFSLSVSMGIMITYGSYVKPEVNLNKAVNQIEIFDTGVALLAGAMIIPAVFVFSGTDGMSAGPSLMFISLPKVFAAMGKAGTFVGLLFFVTTIFATLTSCISVLESITANCMEIFHSGRKKTVLVLAALGARRTEVDIHLIKLVRLIHDEEDPLNIHRRHQEVIHRHARRGIGLLRLALGQHQHFAFHIQRNVVLLRVGRRHLRQKASLAAAQLQHHRLPPGKLLRPVTAQLFRLVNVVFPRGQLRPRLRVVSNPHCLPLRRRSG